MSDADGYERMRHIFVTCPRCEIRLKRRVNRSMDPLCPDCRQVDGRFPRSKINGYEGNR